MEFSWGDYLGDIKKLRKNKENVPIEILKTKYAEPYNELLEKIRRETEKILFQFIFGGILMRKDEPEERDAFLRKAQAIIDEEKAAGTFREIARAVFEEYDADKALDIAAEKLHPRIWLEAYPEYWLKHCIIENDRPIWNDLIQMRWNSDLQIWESRDGTSVTIMLPPTAELIEREREKYGNQENMRKKK
ncbi:MAG: hypothetical protein ACLTIW_09770 [Blautia sp.]